MSRETAFAKIAAMAQLLDDAGLHDDATILDEAMEMAAAGQLHKEAGAWQAILSRLSGWARRALFKEYRGMYAAAKEAQEKANQRLEQLQEVNKELKEMLARHMLTDWRDGLVSLLPAISMPVDETLAPYDEQHASMTARLLKLAPKKAPEDKKPAKPVVSPLMPEDDKGAGEQPPEEGRSPEKAIEEALKSEEPIPLTKVKKPAPAPVPAPEVPEAPGVAEPVAEPATESAPVPPPEPAPAPAVPAAKPESAPLPGWRKERFGTSGKHGWEWEWEISPENNKLRIPKNQLAAAASGKGKILHRQDGRYRPTGGTSSVKLRNLMGNTFWEEENDPTDPNMAILVRTEDVVPFPLSMRREPAEQAQKLKELGKSSAERRSRLLALAVGEMTDEERLEAAAKALLDHFEEEPDTEEG